MVREANSTIWAVAGSVSSTKMISLSHLIHVQPYQLGTMSRMGEPWSAGSGTPLISVARKAPASCNCLKVKTQLAPGVEFWEVVEYWSKPDSSTLVACASMSTRPSTSEIGTPDHSAVLSIPKCAKAPFPEHSIRWFPVGTTNGDKSASDSVRGCDTRPCIWIAQGAVGSNRSG